MNRMTPMTRMTTTLALLLACFGITAPVLAQIETDAPAEKQDLPAPEIELISPGKAPREELRMSPSLNQTEHLQMIMEMTGETAMSNGMSMPMDMPKMTMLMDTTAIRQIDNETYEIETVYVDITSDPNHEMTPMFEGPFRSMKGMKLRTTSNTRGIVTKVEIAYPPGFDPTMQQQMEAMRQSLTQMMVPLPDQPIGVGAKWKVITRATINSMTVEVASTYELLNRTKDSFKLRISYDQTAASQNVTLPQLPPGTTMKLNKMTGSGSAESEFATATFLPIASKLNMKNAVDMSMDMGGTPIDTTTDTDIAMTVERVKPDAKP
ncbi:MAG: hypothetical protein H6815_14190 [Phycisphaeraceae bacterium]|nr:hypothetical protein [Phycisphaerales bacterium]MCB9861590.1 hypothetical protein [Phycisphaeraceae bacterium]